MYSIDHTLPWASVLQQKAGLYLLLIPKLQNQVASRVPTSAIPVIVWYCVVVQRLKRFLRFKCREQVLDIERVHDLGRKYHACHSNLDFGTVNRRVLVNTGLHTQMVAKDQEGGLLKAGSFGGRPASCLARILALSWSIVFVFDSLPGSSRAFCTGYNCWPRRSCATLPVHLKHRDLPPRTIRAVRERRRSASNSKSRGADPRVLTSQISQAKSAAAILNLVGREVDGEVFNEFHMSAAFTRLARFSRQRKMRRTDEGSPVWPRLVARLQAMLQKDSIDARGVANLFWANAELHNKVAGLLPCVKSIVEYMPHKVEEMKPQELSNSLWAAAKLQDEASEVLTAVTAISQYIPDKVEEMQPQALSNSLWAAAKLQDSAPDVLTAVPAIAERILDKVEGMKPQELANSLWAVATLQDAAPEVLAAVQAIARRILDKVEEMQAQDLSSNLWAATKLQGAAPDVLVAVPAMSERVPHKVQDMLPSHLSSCLLSAAGLKDAAPEVLSAVPAVVQQIFQKADDMTSQQLSNSLLAAATLQNAVPEVLNVVPNISECIVHLKGMNSQDLSDNLAAIALLRNASPGALAAVPVLVRQIPAQMRSMKPQQLLGFLRSICGFLPIRSTRSCQRNLLPKLV